MAYTPPALPPELAADPVPAPETTGWRMSGPAPLGFDAETTGLHPVEDHILEIGMALLDRDLRVLASFGNRVVHAGEEQLSRMDDYVLDMHTRSGLLDEVEASTLTLADVEEEIVEWLGEQGVTAPADRRQAPLIMLGNSIRLDRYMVEIKMPRLSALLSHRLADVSGYRELGGMYNPLLVPEWTGAPAGATAHRALDDVHASIIEARAQRAEAMRLSY